MELSKGNLLKEPPPKDLSKDAPIQVRFDTLAKPEDVRAFGSLLNTCFDTSCYFDDFPVWQESRADLIRIGAWKDNRLAACAAARLARVKTPAGSLAVGIIGAVATDPEYRGRGLASRAVQLAVEWLQSRKAAVAILWGSELELYGRLGFELCGLQVSVPLGAMSLGRPPATGIQESWTPAIFRLRQDRPEGLILGPEDLNWFQAHRNVRWYWTGPRDRPDAYAAIGRGIDLQNCVHEWGGEPQALRGLLAQVRERFPEAALLGSPACLERMMEPLGIPPGALSSQYLCLARVLDGEQVLLDYGASIAAPPGDFSLARLYFGPSATSGAESEFFPLPLWLWGLDSA